jgi:hypothetical protein
MSRAYIPDHFFVKPFERDYLLPVFQRNGFNKDEMRFGVHIFTSLKRQREHREIGEVPISHQLRMKQLPQSRIPVIGRVFGWRPHSVEQHRSRRFYFKDPYGPEIESLLTGVTIEEYIAHPSVNFFTGKRVRKFYGRILRDQNNNEEPEGIQKVWSVFRPPVPFNRKNVELHLENLKMRMEMARLANDKEGFEKAQNLYWNDYYCFLAVCDNIAYSEGDISYYHATYRASSSGRLVMVGGGLQNASREMKAAAYSDIPGADIHNVDFVNCHPYLVIQVLEEELGIEPRHLWEYIEDRAKLAQKAGMSEKYFKRSVLALINDAKMPTSARRNPHTGNSVLDFIEEDVGNDPEKVELTRQALDETTKGIRAEIAAFQTYVKTEWMSKREQRKGRGGIRTVENAVGKKLRTDRKYSLGQLTSHYLTGREQQLNNAAILELANNGHRFYSNEFDGFVADGSFAPDELGKLAGDVAGVKYAELREKSFV